MNLVVGATGFLGSEICRQLVIRGKLVRALARPTSDRAKVENLKSLGVELVEGDLKDRSSLDAACHDAMTVLSTATAIGSQQPDNTLQTVDLEGQMQLIDAAKVVGVDHFIYVSFTGSIDFEFPFRNAKRAVEQHLQQSGLTYTILRPSNFMEVWLSPAIGFDFPNAKAQIYGSGHNKISWISLYDVAQFAVESLDNPAARNAIIELGGPEPLSPLEVVQIFEEVSGRSFEVQHVPEEALREQWEAATDPLQQSFAGLMLAYAQGAPTDMSETLQRFPVQLTSVRDYAQRVLATA